MATSKRGKVVGTWALDTLAEPASKEFDVEGANYVTLFIEHTVTGTAALTGLLIEVKAKVDTAVTFGARYADFFENSAPEFPLPEEIPVSGLTSGVAEIPVGVRKYDIDSNLFAGNNSNTGFPLLGFPYSGGQSKLELTVTPTDGSSVDALRILVLADHV